MVEKQHVVLGTKSGSESSAALSAFNCLSSHNSKVFSEAVSMRQAQGSISIIKNNENKSKNLPLQTAVSFLHDHPLHF